VFVLTCGGGEQDNAAFGVLLHDDGTVVDYLKLNSIHVNSSREKKEADLQKLAEFIAANYSKIDLCVVSGWSVLNNQLFQELQLIVKQEHQKILSDDNTPEVQVHFANDDLARIWMKSEQAEQEFPNYNPLMRYCISVGRCVQEPLIEYACFFNSSSLNPTGDILKLRIHENQDFLQAETLYDGLEREIMIAINSVGADINRLAAHTYGHFMLQYVPGFGIRKAMSLLEKLKTKYGTLFIDLKKRFCFIW
jgi:transcription elongation factor SPT6